MTILAYVLAMAAASSAPPLVIAQLTIRQRIIIRVPAATIAAPPPTPPRLRWKEKKGPACIPANGLAGAAVMRPDAVDLVTRGGQRFRAQLADECPALDFYSGFYILPSGDGQICAGRDMLRSRAGGQCPIARFRIVRLQR